MDQGRKFNPIAPIDLEQHVVEERAGKRHNQSRLYVIGALEELGEFERARKRFGKKAEGYTGECYGCANRADSRFTRHWQTFSNFGEFVVIFVVTRASFRADFGPFYL